MSDLYDDAILVACARQIDNPSNPGALAESVAAAIAPLIAAKALREMADRTIAEAVCCDEYEAFKAGVPRPKYAHHICYWGAAHAEALRDRASELDPS